MQGPLESWIHRVPFCIRGSQASPQCGAADPRAAPWGSPPLGLSFRSCRGCDPFQSHGQGNKCQEENPPPRPLRQDRAMCIALQDALDVGGLAMCWGAGGDPSCGPPAERATGNPQRHRGPTASLYSSGSQGKASRGAAGWAGTPTKAALLRPPGPHQPPPWDGPSQTPRSTASQSPSLGAAKRLIQSLPVSWGCRRTPGLVAPWQG